MCNLNQPPPENAPPPIIPFPDNLGKPLQLQIALGLLAVSVLIDLHSPSIAHSSLVHSIQLVAAFIGFFFLYEWWKPPRQSLSHITVDGNTITDLCRCHLVEDNADTPIEKKPCQSESCSSASSSAQTAVSSSASIAHSNDKVIAQKPTDDTKASQIQFKVTDDAEPPQRNASEIQRFQDQRDRFEAGVFTSLLEHQRKRDSNAAEHTRPTQSDRSMKSQLSKKQ
ncbi:unnamed protein product, partial [Mesorhabditis belari]|uniref:Uncharacterized protein n=1 Tax=Mesorhabditis belari TaxID=2138241 RepID=A0AAF3F3Q9_9BILA